MDIDFPTATNVADSDIDGSVVAGVLGSVIVVLVLMCCLMVLVVSLLLWKRNKEKNNSDAGNNLDLSNPNYDSSKIRNVSSYPHCFVPFLMSTYA